MKNWEMKNINQNAGNAVCPTILTEVKRNKERYFEVLRIFLHSIFFCERAKQQTHTHEISIIDANFHFSSHTVASFHTNHTKPEALAQQDL